MRGSGMLLFFMAIAPGVANAEDVSDEIVVLGQGLASTPGTPAYGSVLIDHDRLENSASGRIENILSDVAGFQQFRRSDSRSANPSAQGATLRALGGNASSRTLVLLDGVPMADPFFGYIPFSALIPERLDQIRVTRGGGSGAFGAGAVAGTIELESAARDALPVVAASGAYGSKNASELSASLSPDLGAGFLSVSGRWDRGDGFQTTPVAQRVAATSPARYDSWSIGARGVAPISGDAELQFRGLAFHDARTLRFIGANSLSEGEDASIRLVSRGPWQVDALAYLQLRNFSNVVISSTTFRRSLDQRNTPSTGIGGKLELRPPVGTAHVLRIGADVRQSSGTAYEDAYNATGAVTARRHTGGNQRTVGLFAEDDWTLGSLVLTGGLRADRWAIDDGYFQSVSPAGLPTVTSSFPNRHDWDVSARAGALYHLTDGIALRGAGYTGFRLPTLNELYRSFTVFPITTQANAALNPEKLKGVETGLDLRPFAGTVLSVTGFYNRLDNAIANVTTGTNVQQRQNVKAIIAKGLEVTASARLGPVHVSASYAYSHSIVDAPGLALDGLAPAQTPRHAASATIAWEKPAGPALSATLHYVSSQFEDDLHTSVLRSAFTVDGVARLPLGQGVSLTGRVENLFDATVITRNAGGSMDLGTPRTLWIGFRFEH